MFPQKNPDDIYSFLMSRQPEHGNKIVQILDHFIFKWKNGNYGGENDWENLAWNAVGQLRATHLFEHSKDRFIAMLRLRLKQTSLMLGYIEESNLQHGIDPDTIAIVELRGGGTVVI